MTMATGSISKVLRIKKCVCLLNYMQYLAIERLRLQREPVSLARATHSASRQISLTRCPMAPLAYAIYPSFSN